MSGEAKGAVERARHYFREGKTRDLDRRRAGLHRLEFVLMERRDDLLEALSDHLGKPGLEAHLSEYHFLLQEIRLVRKKLKRWLERNG